MESTENAADHGSPLTIDSLLDVVQAAPPRLGRTRLIGIDGPAGPGKTTVAAPAGAGAEPRVLNPYVTHMDALYDGGPGAERGFVLRRAHVLHPPADGREGGYRRYDWYAGA